MLRAIAFVLIAVPAGAQIPETFTNLEVFPADVSRQELMGAMREFSFALGVRCEHCHVGGPALDTIDFAADDEEPKRIARRMLAMVNAINDEHLAKLPREGALVVRCGTCHGGVSRPEAIESIVERELEAGGVASVEARYRELRQEYFGSKSYDFGVGPLNRVGERLVREGRAREGLALLVLNQEFHPDSSWLSNLLGEAYLASGERERARRAFERTLELDPASGTAKRRLEELRDDPEP